MQAKPADSVSDETLLNRIQEGERAAFSTLVARYLRDLHGFAQRHLGDPGEAEDVVQETFIRVWQHAERWQPGAAKPSTWLYQITRNLCIDRLRRRRPQAALDEQQADETHSQAALMQREQVGVAVQQAIQNLPESQRSALLLCHYQGLRNQDAAAVLGLSVSALESLLARARRGLRKQLQGQAEHLLGEVD